MALIQVALEVPDDIYIALLDGELTRRGGVVRDAAGQIVAHLKDVGLVDDDAAKAVAEKAAALAKQNKELLKQNQELARHAAELAKQNKVILIGVGVAAAVATVGGAVFHIVKSRANKKKATISGVQASFNEAMKNYLDSLRSGNLNDAALNDIIANVDAVKEDLDGGMLTIDFSNSQLDVLVAMLKDYTERLAIANDVALSDEPKSVDGDELANVLLLRHYLCEQQRILNAA